MKRVLVGLLVAAMLGLGAPAFAGEGAGSRGCTICDGTTSDSWGVKTSTQLTRGVANTGLCWMELVNQPMKAAKGGENVVIGFGKGIGHACLRFIQGVGEIVTAPMPKAKDGSQIATDCPICMWSV